MKSIIGLDKNKTHSGILYQDIRPQKREPFGSLFFIYQNMILNNHPNDFLFSYLH